MEAKSGTSSDHGDLHSDQLAGFTEPSWAGQAVIYTARLENGWTDSISFPRFFLNFTGFPRISLPCVQSWLLRCINVSDATRRQITIMFMFQLF